MSTSSRNLKATIAAAFLTIFGQVGGVLAESAPVKPTYLAVNTIRAIEIFDTVCGAAAPTFKKFESRAKAAGLHFYPGGTKRPGEVYPSSEDFYSNDTEDFKVILHQTSNGAKNCHVSYGSVERIADMLNRFGTLNPSHLRANGPEASTLYRNTNLQVHLRVNQLKRVAGRVRLSLSIFVPK